MKEEKPNLGKLPWKEADTLPPSSAYVALLHSLVRRHANKVLSGQPVDFNAELTKYVERIQTEAYELGIKTGERIAMLAIAPEGIQDAGR